MSGEPFDLHDASILITGGTGSFGRTLVRTLLETTEARRIVVFSRDEFKQHEMRTELDDDRRLRFFLGDVRDRQRLTRAFDGIDVVVHAAALKQIGAAEYNPFEAVRTNVLGAQNVVDAAIDNDVGRVIALSTDKASSPLNLYGATKLVSDKLFVHGNAYVGARPAKFSVVRYGNVIGSRGSVVPFFRARAASGEIPITDTRMTRFWITLQQGVDFVLQCLETMHGGEIFVPKIPSMRVTDLATAIAPDASIRVIGIRPGEKLHEEMISLDDGRRSLDLGDRYVIQPEFEWWFNDHPSTRPVPDGFVYRSDTNDQWLDAAGIAAMLDHV